MKISIPKIRIRLHFQATRRQLAVASVVALVLTSTLYLMAGVSQAAISLRATSSANVSDQIGFSGGSTGTGVTTYTSGSSTTTTVVLNKPSGTVQGDVMLAVITFHGGTGVTLTAPTCGGTGAAWASLQRNNSTTAIGQQLYWCQAGASEASSYTWSGVGSNKATGILVSLTNVASSSPIDNSNGQNNTSSATETAPALSGTTAIAGEFNLGFFSENSSATYTATNMTTLGSTGVLTTGGNSSTRSSSSYAYSTLGAAGSSVAAHTATAGTTSSVNIGQQVTVKPANATSLAIAMPTGTVQNDVMIAALTVTGGSGVTISAPSGWTEADDCGTTPSHCYTSGNEIKTQSWYKVAGASEAGPYSFSWSGNQRASGAIIAYSGVDTSSLVDVSGSQANASSTTITAPSVTTTKANDQLVGVFGIANAGTITSSLTDEDYTSASGSTSSAVRIGDAALGAAGATGTKTATAGTAGVSVGQLIALTPAASSLSQESSSWQSEANLQPGNNTWIARTAAADSNWQSVAYGGGQFAAVGNGAIMTSPDGGNWASQSGSSGSMSGITYGNGKFVAVGDASGGGGGSPTLDQATTLDGSALGGNFTWSNSFTVAGNSNRYLLVSISDSGCAQPTSVTYNSVSMGSTIGTVAANGTNFCSWTYGLTAPASGSNALAITTPSLKNPSYDVVVQSWYNVNQTTPFGTFSSNFAPGTNTPTASVSATSVSGRVVADAMFNQTAAQGSTATPSKTQSSFHDYTATSQVQVGSSYTTAAGTSTSMSWSGLDPKVPSTTFYWTESAIDLIGAGGGGTGVLTSSDGVTWTSQTAAASNTWSSVAYGNGTFVAVAKTCSSNCVMTSTDGVTWTAQSAAVNNDWTGVTYGNGRFVAVSSSGTGNRVMTSPDGATWTSQTSAANNTWNSVTFGNGQFVAVASSCASNCVMTSPDGFSWTSRTAAANNNWNSVAYGGGEFVAVSSSGTGNRVMTSPDGVSWTSQTNPVDNNWYGVGYGNNMFVAVANSSGVRDEVMTSDNQMHATAATWTARAHVTETINWASITYGNGLYVAVSNNCTVASTCVETSPDGITWTSRTAPNTNHWQSVTYGNGLFVAVSSTGSGSNQVMTSTNGITWSAQTTPVGTLFYSSVTYGNGTFVAIVNDAANAKAMTSTNGTTWTGQNTALASNWQNITYGNGLFVAVASTGKIQTSATGATGTWTTQTSPAVNSWYSTAYGNGVFVSVSQSGTGNRIMTSPDGVTWTSRVNPVDNNWNGIVYGNGLFVAVANNCASASNCVMTSPDGIAWTSRAAASTNNWDSVTYGNGIFVATAYSGTNRVMTAPGIDASTDHALVAQDTSLVDHESDSVRLRLNVGVSGLALNAKDGQSFALQYGSTSGTCNGSETYYDVGTGPLSAQSAAANAAWQAVTYGSGLFVAVSVSGGVMSSPDGITWTSQTSAANNFWRSVTYGNGLFVAVSSTGTGNRVMTSPDGINWTSQTSAANNVWNSVTYGNGTFVAVSNGLEGTTTEVMTSTNGSSWATHTAAANLHWNGVTYGNGLFVAVADNGTANGVMTSPDGTNWTTRTTPQNSNWYSVAYGNGMFVSLSDGSEGFTDEVMYSPDGINWTLGNTSADNIWSSVTYGGGLFVAVSTSASGNVAMTSPDGIRWTNHTSVANNSWNSITYGNGVFVTTSNGQEGVSTEVETMSPAINWGGSLSNNYGTITANSGIDPTEGGVTTNNISQQYVSNNYFSAVQDTAAGKYAQWDFDLNMYYAGYDSSYCLRVVNADESTINTYSLYPQITRCTVPPSDRRLIAGTAFCNGSAQWFWDQ